MLPLEQKTVKVRNTLNHEEEIPGLDPTRAEQRHFVNYVPPPVERLQSDSISTAEMDNLVVQWKERMMFIFEDLNWLLKLPHDLFWCQAIFDNTLHSCLDSFLQYAPRYFDKLKHPSRCQEIQSRISKLMLLTILRLCADQESKENFISPDVYGEILYENFLFDVPKIMDICSLFCGSSQETRGILSKATGNIFEKQPRYLDDLDATVTSLLETFNVIGEKLNLVDQSDIDEPKELPSAEAKSLSSRELHDMILYLYDTAHTLVAFLEIFPNGSLCFLKRDIIQRVAVIIENYLPTINQKLKSFFQEDATYYVKQTSKCFVKVCHMIFQQCFVKKAEESSSEAVKHQLFEDYVQIMTSLLSHIRFLGLYEKRHGVQKDFEAFKVSNSYINEESSQYILSAIHSIQVMDQSQKGNASKKEDDEAACEGAEAAIPENIVRDGINQVRELFPRLKNEFVRSCIFYYNGDGQEVINHLLEDSLPDFLKELKGEDTSHPPPEPETGSSRPVGNDLPGSYYLKGKHVSKLEQKTVLDDKSASSYVKDRVKAEQLEQERKFAYDEYDDEYDDTYDSHNVGAMDADSGDELKDITQRRSFVKPRVLQVLENENAFSENDSESETNEENADEDNGPEKQRDQQQMGFNDSYRGKGRGFYRGSGARPRPNTGQRGSTGREVKAKKHNRKDMAAKKMSRGMGPLR